MKPKAIKIFFLTSILIQMFVITSLATGSPILTMPVIQDGGLPWGNLMTAVLFILFPLNFLLIRSSRKIHQIPRLVFRVCVLLSLAMGLLWIPFSFLLTGNWSASFSGQDSSSQIWWAYTYATPLLPFAGYFLMRFLLIFFKPQSNAAKN